MHTVLTRSLSTTGWSTAARALALAALLAAAGRAPVEAQPMQSDIVDTAVAAGSFTTLATALQAAGLVDTLKGSGPFTVFAPDRRGVRQAAAGTVDALLADPDQLRAVLTYHVVPGARDRGRRGPLTSALDRPGAAAPDRREHGRRRADQPAPASRWPMSWPATA